MTPEQRLEQLEILMSTAAKNINANIATLARLSENQAQTDAQVRDNAAQVRANTEAIARLTENQARTDARLAEAIDIIVDTLRVIREMQTEVRGLQIENRRILEHLFGENQQPPEDQIY